MRTTHTVGPEVITDAVFNNEVVRGPLTRNIKPLFSELHDEVTASFQEYIPATKGTFHRCLSSILTFCRVDQSTIHECITSHNL
jgi:hypothetical protein